MAVGTKTYPRPDLEQVRAYLKVPATALSDEDLERIIHACDEAQQARCNGVEEDPETRDITAPDGLNQALLRRVQREVAARNLPLGMVGLDAAEFGPERLPQLDALVEEHERPWRKQVLA